MPSFFTPRNADYRKGLTRFFWVQRSQGMPIPNPPRALPLQTAHKVGIPFVIALTLALVAGLPATGFALVTTTSIGLGSAALTGVAAVIGISLILLLIIIGVAGSAGAALTSVGLGGVASVGLGASSILGSGSLGLAGSAGGVIASVTSPFVGLAGSLGGASTIPTTGLGGAILGSTLSASTGLVGSLAPLTYSPGTLATLANQAAGQVLGLLTQAVS